MKQTKKEKILQKILVLEEALEKSRVKTQKAKQRYQKEKRKREALKIALSKKKAALIPRPEPENAPQESINNTIDRPTGSRLLAPGRLRMIKGIGPGLEKILQNAGIDSFETLACFDAVQVKQILLEAGPHFQHYDPSDWLDQARQLARKYNKKVTDSSEYTPKSSEKEKK